MRTNKVRIVVYIDPKLDDKLLKVYKETGISIPKQLERLLLLGMKQKK